MEILRAFRPGSELLGNSDIAERTGLSKATVSRLTQTLVGSGMLQIEKGARAYRLAPAVLSLAHAMRTGSQLLGVAAPLMRSLAEELRINVGLAAADRDEMVYLESFRYSRRIALRQVVSGLRVPMELTSLGHAYLATLSDTRRGAFLDEFKRRRPQQWPALGHALDAARESIRQRDVCAASWQPEVVAVATPMENQDSTYVLNVSVSSADPIERVVRQLRPRLLELKQRIHAESPGFS